MNFIEVAFRILVAHSIGDFALQSPVMAKYKSPKNKVPKEMYNKGQKAEPMWFYYLTSHALILGACIWMVSGDWKWGVIEAVFHWVIDFGKCNNKYGVKIDQALHMVSRIPAFIWMLWS